MVSCTVVGNSSLFSVVGDGVGRRCIVVLASAAVVVVFNEIGFTASLASLPTGLLVGLVLAAGRGFVCEGLLLAVGRRVINGLGLVA